jgi:hypothetical protein
MNWNSVGRIAITSGIEFRIYKSIIKLSYTHLLEMKWNQPNHKYPICEPASGNIYDRTSKYPAWFGYSVEAHLRGYYEPILG